MKNPYQQLLKKLQHDPELFFEHHPLTGTIRVSGWEVEYDPEEKVWTLSEEE